MCLLDDEETAVPGTMRATGDWVNVKDGQLCYLGRKDRLIKRHGKRVNLDSLQQVRCFHVLRWVETKVHRESIGAFFTDMFFPPWLSEYFFRFRGERRSQKDHECKSQKGHTA